MGVTQSTEWRMAMAYVRASMLQEPELETETKAGTDVAGTIVVACLPARIQRYRACPDDFPAALQRAWALGQDIGVVQLQQRPDDAEAEERERDVDAPDESVTVDWEQFVLCEGAHGLALFPRFGRVIVMSADDDTGASARPSTGAASTPSPAPTDAAHGNVFVPGAVTGGLRPGLGAGSGLGGPALAGKREPPEHVPATHLVPPQPSAPASAAAHAHVRFASQTRRERAMQSLSAFAP